MTTNIVESQTDSEVVEQTETNYADDEIVNKFISEFQEIAGYKMTDISKGTFAQSTLHMQIIVILK